MVLDVDNKIDRYDRDNFGLSLLPIYRFSRLMRAFSASLWLGRTIYIVTHIFGAIPHFNILLAIAKQIFIKADSSEAKKAALKSDRLLFQQDEFAQKTDDTKVHDQKAFDWDDYAQEKAGISVDRCRDDFALARLLQEEADAEEAKKLQSEGEKADPFSQLTPFTPKPLVVDDDLAFAQRLQAQLFQDEDIRDPLTGKEVAAVIKEPIPQTLLDLNRDKLRAPLKAKQLDWDAAELDAAAQIIGTPGLQEFKKEDKKTKETYSTWDLCGENIRGVAALIGKECPQALSPSALKAVRGVDLEQYLAFELKRFGHAEELQGSVTLPTGKQIKLEGTWDVFTAPWIMSSFKEFAERSVSLDNSDKILNSFKNIWFNDYVARRDLEPLVTSFQSPDYVGPDVFSIGFDIHCSAIIWYRGCLLYLDTGSDNIDHGIYVFRLPHPELITEDFLWERIKREDIKEKDYDPLAVLTSELNADLIHHHPMPSQIVGNCAYATMKAVLKGLMAIDQMEESIKKTSNKSLGKKEWASSFLAIDAKFDKWEAFDQEMVFDEFVSEVREWLSSTGTFGKEKLKKTYQEALTFWKFGGRTNKNPTQIAEVNKLLQELDKHS